MRAYLDELFSKVQAVSIRERGGEELGLEKGLRQLLGLFQEKRRQGRTVCFIGNGGSASIAIHMTADFFKNGGMKTASLLDVGTITCFGNDYGYEHIFSKQIERVMGEGDLLVAISSSGRSPNILNAIAAAHQNGAEVLSFTGFSPDNPARAEADVSLYVSSGEYGLVESAHNLLLQELADKLKGETL